METVIVPLDGSSCADEAFEYALGLAKAQGARIKICSVVDPVAIVGHSLPRPIKDKPVADAKRDAGRIVNDAVTRAMIAGIQAEGRVIIGQPAIKIIAYAATAKAGTIIMGTHGRSGFKQLSIGGVVREVLRSATCHVVIVREQANVPNAPAHLPAYERDLPVSVLRLIEVDPNEFERLYGEIASFMDGIGAELPGVSQTEVLGSFDSTRIVILAEFRSHADWVRAQWDTRLGELLEEITVNSQTLEFGLYHGDHFPSKTTALQSTR